MPEELLFEETRRPMRPWIRLLLCFFTSALLHTSFLLVQKSSGLLQDRKGKPLPVELMNPQGRFLMNSWHSFSESRKSQTALSKASKPRKPIKADPGQEPTALLEQSRKSHVNLPPSSPGPASSTEDPLGIASLSPHKSCTPTPFAGRSLPENPDLSPMKDEMVGFPRSVQEVEGNLIAYTGSNSNLSSTLREEYLVRIKKEVERNWQVRSGGGPNDGATVLLVVMDADGFLRSLDLHRSSGTILRDVEAMEAVKRSLPFQPPPMSLLNRKGRLIIRFSFRYPIRPPS